jgi:hypothetical protein
MLGLALLTLLVAGPARAATPYAEAAFFSDFGHPVGDGSEWRWTSDDQTIDAYVEGNRLTVEASAKSDDRVKHYFEFSSEPGTPFRRGVFRVPDSEPLFGVPGKPAISITDLEGSRVYFCPYHSWGDYEVRDLAVGADGQVQRAWIVYEQRCDRAAYGAFGEIRIGMPDAEPLATLPSMVRWPAYDAGHAARSVPVRVYATQAVTATQVVGADASAFRIEEDGCSGAGTGFCDVRVRYRTPAPGTHQAWLAIDDAAGRRSNVPLQGFSYGGVTSLDVVSEPGDFVGGGDSYHYGPEADYYFDSEIPSHIGGWLGTRLWSFAFDAPGREPLVPGTYDGAVDHDPSLPEFSIGHASRGCNHTSGTFTVQDLVHGQGGVEIRSLAVSFEQQCDGRGLLRGTLKHRYGDTTPDPPWMTSSTEPTDVGVPPDATPPTPTATASPSPTPAPSATPSATPTGTPSPTPTGTPSPTPTGTPSPTPTETTSPSPATAQNPIVAITPTTPMPRDRAAPRIALTRGSSVRPARLTLSEPAKVTTSLRHNGRAIRRTFTLAAGQHTLTARRLAGRTRLAHGRYTLTVHASDLAGNAAVARRLRFTA